MKYEHLPDILTAAHISRFLGISRRIVYELMKRKPEKGGIRSFSIGTSRRTEKKDLIEWIEQKKEEAV